MKQYSEVVFSPVQSSEVEILIAFLGDLDFYAFQTEDQKLKAYSEIPVDANRIKSMLPPGCNFQIKEIEDRDWNRQWEENFQPVSIDDFVNIRAVFHPVSKVAEYDIVITPQMSFGTGHHATTRLMIRLMRSVDIAGKTIIDFGTGTGVLAILARKMGAAQVYAIDNDDWSIRNAKQNIEDNRCGGITVLKAGNLEELPVADILLANINLNILMDHLPGIVAKTIPEGFIILSGFLEEDESSLNKELGKFYCKMTRCKRENGWSSMVFERTE